MAGDYIKVPPFKNPKAWTQKIVDERWLAIGNPGGVAPLLPASLVGCAQGPGRALLAITCPGKKNRARTREEADFLNMFYKVAVDPFREVSTISKVAGAILEAAAIVIPAAGAVSAVTSTANQAIAAGNVKRDTAQIMNQLQAAANARALEVPPAASDPVTGAMLPEFAPSLTQPAVSAALSLNASPATLVTLPSVRSAGLARTWSSRDYLVAGGALALLYLLFKR